MQWSSFCKKKVRLRRDGGSPLSTRRIRDKRWAQETAEKNKMWYRKDEEIKQLKVVDQSNKALLLYLAIR